MNPTNTSTESTTSTAAAMESVLLSTEVGVENRTTDDGAMEGCVESCASNDILRIGPWDMIQMANFPIGTLWRVKSYNSLRTLARLLQKG